MTTSRLVAPQLILDSRMLYTNWIPADPAACAALLPPALKPARNHAVAMDQYVVDSADQTTGFGAFSLTYLGLDLAAYSAPGKPGRFYTHFINSSQAMRAYVTERGVPATPGTTELELVGDALTATTYEGGKPIIRTRARVSDPDDTFVAGGHARYLTRVRDRLLSGMYPYIAHVASSFELVSIEFLDPSHPTYALRPRLPLELISYECFYSPRTSVVYPGGEEDVGPADVDRG